MTKIDAQQQSHSLFKQPYLSGVWRFVIVSFFCIGYYPNFVLSIIILISYLKKKDMVFHANLSFAQLAGSL